MENIKLRPCCFDQVIQCSRVNVLRLKTDIPIIIKAECWRLKIILLSLDIFLKMTVTPCWWKLLTTGYVCVHGHYGISGLLKNQLIKTQSCTI